MVNKGKTLQFVHFGVYFCILSIFALCCDYVVCSLIFINQYKNINTSFDFNA